MGNLTRDPDSRPVRIPALDIARTLALAGMVAFHFTFDLAMFGVIAPGTTNGTPFWELARLVAGSFLFLAGVSLWLAHGRRIRWRAFWRRFVIIAGAAAVISVATRIALPDRFIFFGILHSIAAASLIGLAFLRLPPTLILTAAAGTFALSRVPILLPFDSPLLWGTGLSVGTPASVDFLPLVPWLSPFLAGMALAKILDRAGGWESLRQRSMPGPFMRALSFPGRHSLIIYLVHQPVLIGLLWSVLRVWG